MRGVRSGCSPAACSFYFVCVCICICMCVMCYVHDGGEGRVLTCCLQCVRVYLCVRVCVYCVYCVCESMCVLYAGGLRSGCSPAACSV